MAKRASSHAPLAAFSGELRNSRCIEDYRRYDVKGRIMLVGGNLSQHMVTSSIAVVKSRQAKFL
jgi:hypothetical protein